MNITLQLLSLTSDLIITNLYNGVQKVEQHGTEKIRVPWIHFSHQLQMRKSIITSTILITGVLIVSIMPPLPAAIGLASYLPLHLLLELISVVVAMMIFSVGWSTYKQNASNNILFLACTFLAIGLLDFSHALSFAGMPDFITPSGAEKAINFWLAARSMGAMILLAIAIRSWRPATALISRFIPLFAIISMVFFLHWLFLFYSDKLPATFIPGQGLTPFKIYYEYILISLNLITLGILWLKMSKVQSFNIAAFFGAVFAMALSEYLFTLYSDVTDVYNLLGHIYKIISYWFFYRAIFTEAIEQPYQALHENNTLLDNILDNIPNMIFLKYASDLRFKLFNKAGEKLLGQSRSELLGKNDYDIFPEQQADHFTRLDMETLQQDDVVTIPAEKITTPHGERTLMTRKIVLRNQQGKAEYLLGVSEDITERQRTEKRIENLAHFDQLTNLPNHVLLNDRFKTALSIAKRYDQKMAVMFLDLDNFKTVNDSLGHSIGDQLLKEVARVLKSNMREEDTVSRLGGDEFILLFPNSNQTEATYIASKLIREIFHPFFIHQYELTTTASIGIAIYPYDGDNLETLSKNADTAMYCAKRSGRNNFYFFTSEMQASSERTLQLSNALRHALENNEFQLHYQPQISIRDNSLIGVEALLRWNHPGLGDVLPAEFIPVAESSGEIVSIGEWVVRNAARQMKAWIDQGLKPMTMAVNLSTLQFRQTDLATVITNILDEIQLPYKCLELELTEAVAMENPNAVIKVMDRLHALGIHMSIDDFGTGYSSLSYLKKFKISKLKIDRSFVRDLSSNPEDQAIVKAIINMASSLGLKTIAEGVENIEQLEFLKLNGCDEIQGFYFSQALTAEQFSLFASNTDTLTN